MDIILQALLVDFWKYFAKYSNSSNDWLTGPYSWDEPILPAQLTAGVKGGSSANYNLDRLEEGERLYYENFIYIAMTDTFTK